MPLAGIYQRIMGKHLPSYKLLVCIYTCEKHKQLLRQFYKSILGQYLKGLSGTRILEVYADPEIPHSTIDNNKLVLRTEESYDALSLKTHEMIGYCVNHFDFQYLLKIDVTIIMTHFDEPEYRDRNPVDINKLIRYLKSSAYEKDYDGFIFHSHAARNNAESWASKKGGTINYEKLFGKGHLPPFFSGKCYILSKRFAEYVSQYGHEVAIENKKYFFGSEDVMIGRLYERFTRTLLLD